MDTAALKKKLSVGVGTTMKKGIAVLITDYTVTPAVAASKCEALGFDSFFLPEHAMVPLHTTSPYPVTGRQMPKSYWKMIDPFIGLMHAAGATKNIKLGTSISLVAEHNPIILAKELATLDVLSGGRIIYAIGAGWLKEEMEIMSVPFKHRWAVTCEHILALKNLWTAEISSFDGEYVRFPELRSFPKPLQKPHIPVLIGAGGTANASKGVDRGLKYTVEVGDGWHPAWMPPDEIAVAIKRLKQMCDAAGRDFREMDITLTLPPKQAMDGKTLVEKYEEAGVTRLVFQIGPLPWPRMEAHFEDIAQRFPT